MAKAEELKKAINNNKDVPIDVVPDNAVGGSNYGQELVNQQQPGTFRYGAGPSTYSTIAPGTKTLSALQFEEDKRIQSVAEQLAAAKAARGGSGGGGGQKTSAQGSYPKLSKTELKAQYKEWLSSLNDEYSYKDTQGRELWTKHNDPVSVALGAIENESAWLKEMGLGVADIEELRNYARNNLNTASQQGYNLRSLKEPAQTNTLLSGLIK